MLIYQLIADSLLYQSLAVISSVIFSALFVDWVG